MYMNAWTYVCINTRTCGHTQHAYNTHAHHHFSLLHICQYFNTGGIAGGVFQLVDAAASAAGGEGGGGSGGGGGGGMVVTSEGAEVGWAVCISDEFVRHPFCQPFAGM